MEYVFGVVCFGLIAGVLLAAWFAARVTRQGSETRANASAVLDETFDGSDVVTYHAGPAALPLDVVVAGAMERGYDLLTKGDRDRFGTETLVFKRITP